MHGYATGYKLDKAKQQGIPDSRPPYRVLRLIAEDNSISIQVGVVLLAGLIHARTEADIRNQAEKHLRRGLNGCIGGVKDLAGGEVDAWKVLVGSGLP